MASPISATIDESRCWTTERVMGSIVTGMDGPLAEIGCVNLREILHNAKVGASRIWLATSGRAKPEASLSRWVRIGEQKKGLLQMQEAQVQGGNAQLRAAVAQHATADPIYER